MSTTAAVEIIHVTQGHIVAGEEFNLALGSLKERASAIVVHDATTYAEAREIVKQGNDEIKRISALAEPELQRLRRAVEELRGQRDKLVALFAGAIEKLDRDSRQWNIAEQEAAKKEQEQLNKGKRAENRVTVKPSIPSVPGTAVRVKYDFEVVDISKMKREFMQPDAVNIRTQAREDADPAKTEKTVGGIRVIRS